MHTRRIYNSTSIAQAAINKSKRKDRESDAEASDGKERDGEIDGRATLTLICMLIHGPFQGSVTKAVVELHESAINPLSIHDEPQHTASMQRQSVDGGDVRSYFRSFK